jgi:hypothetical protein
MGATRRAHLLRSGFTGVPFFYMGVYGIRPYKKTAFGALTIPNAAAQDLILNLHFVL